MRRDSQMYAGAVEAAYSASSASSHAFCFQGELGGVMRTLALAAISAALLADIAATRIMSVRRCGLSIAAHRLEHPLTATGTVFWSPLIVESLALAAAVIYSGARSCSMW